MGVEETSTTVLTSFAQRAEEEEMKEPGRVGGKFKADLHVPDTIQTLSTFSNLQQ